jgi:serine/threonine protein phosphatase PrpC
VTLYLRLGARSDVGLVRDGNEDSLFAGERLLAVADGVGGAAYGEVASATTISVLTALDATSSEDLDDPLATLRSSVITANDRLREMTDRHPELAGMGTTLTAMLWSRQRLGLAQVGDSRAYRLRDGTLEQISRDQTFVQLLVDEGRITAEQALHHPQRSVILNAIDGRPDVEPTLDLLDPQVGDRYLLCSDGLSDYVELADITSALSDGDPQPTCDRLVELALDAGAPDNVSCIVADVVDQQPQPDDRLPITAARRRPAAQSTSPTDTPLGIAAQHKPRPRTLRHPTTRPSGPRRGPSVGRRLGIVAGVVVVLVAVAVVGTVIYSRHQYYVATTGAAPSKLVAIYQGVHGHAPGIGSHVEATTDLPASALPEDERQQVDGSGISASGRSGAQQVVAHLRQDACALATATPTTAPEPSPGPTGASTSPTHPKKAAIPTWCAS